MGKTFIYYRLLIKKTQTTILIVSPHLIRCIQAIKVLYIPQNQTQAL